MRPMPKSDEKSQLPVSTPEEAEALYKGGMIRSNPNEPIGEENPEDVIWNKRQRPLSEVEEGLHPDTDREETKPKAS
jgi:hypothetical protein